MAGDGWYSNNEGLRVEVTQTPDGKWAVIDANGNVLATCSTNAEAWKVYDRLANEPQTRRELVNAWIAKRNA